MYYKLDTWTQKKEYALELGQIGTAVISGMTGVPRIRIERGVEQADRAQAGTVVDAHGSSVSEPTQTTDRR